MGRFFKERPRYGDERPAPADRADLFGSDEKANPFEKAEVVSFHFRFLAVNLLPHVLQKISPV